MKRRPFAIYFGGLVLCVLVFFGVEIFYSRSFIVTGAWFGGVLLLLSLPFVLSMRLRDAGFHPAWGLLPLAGLPVLIWMLFIAYTPIGRASSGISTQGRKLAEYFGMLCIIYLGMLSLFSVLAPTKSIPNRMRPIND